MHTLHSIFPEATVMNSGVLALHRLLHTGQTVELWEARQSDTLLGKFLGDTGWNLARNFYERAEPIGKNTIAKGFRIQKTILNDAQLKGMWDLLDDEIRLEMLGVSLSGEKQSIPGLELAITRGALVSYPPLESSVKQQLLTPLKEIAAHITRSDLYRELRVVLYHHFIETSETEPEHQYWSPTEEYLGQMLPIQARR